MNLFLRVNGTDRGRFEQYVATQVGVPLAYAAIKSFALEPDVEAEEYLPCAYNYYHTGTEQPLERVTNLNYFSQL